MPEKKIYIEGIPQGVTLRKNTRIKRLSIKISTHSGVVVCAPEHINEQQATNFLIMQKKWVLKHLQKEKYKTAKFPARIQLVTTIISFEETEHNEPIIKRKNNSITVNIPNFLSFEKKEQLKRNLLTKLLRKEAKQFLTQRVAELAVIHGFKYGKLSFRNQKTRWGSCSYHNNISLNIQLMRLPLHLIDYVIIHELCHTVHKNHSATFWQLVRSKIGDSVYFCKKEMQSRRIEL